MVDTSRADETMRSAPLGLVGLLVLVSIWWDGGFDFRYWAPLTLLALATLLSLAAAGTLSLPRRGPLLLSVAAVWALAVYTMISAAWSESPATALEGAARAGFYAALFTIAIGTPVAPRWKAALGAGLVLGVVAIGAATELRMLFGAADSFLAGRLNDPVGYRNGTAALFAFATLPLIGIAARRGIASGARAAALASAVLLLGLTWLTQSRGVLLGLVAGLCVFLAVGPDRLRRSWLFMAAVALLILASNPLLSAYHASDGGLRAADAADVRFSAYTLLLVVVASFLFGLFAFIFDNGLRSERVAKSIRDVAVGGLVFIVALLAIVAVIRVGDPVSYAGDKLDEFRSIEATSAEGSIRLGSVGGQRYDLWRVAIEQMSDHPLAGAGEGSYRFAYFRERRTDRNVAYAHGLPFRVLAELGLVGAGLLVAWLGGLAFAVARRARSAAPEARLWIASLAAAGTTIVVQAGVDWLWFVPGLFGLGVLALGLAAGGASRARAGPPNRPLARVAVATVLFVAVAGVGILFLSGVFVRKARQELADSPRAALSSARSAAALNPVSVTPLYLEASTLETLDRRGAARRALQEALELEPNNFVTLGVLGDLEARAGNLAAARNYYRRARALNPLDTGLQELSGIG